MGKLMGTAVVIGVIVVVVGAAIYLNYLPNPFASNVAMQPPNSATVIADISWLTSVGADQETVNTLAEMDIKIYGINDGCISCVVSWYENQNAQDGWTVKPEASAEDRGTGWHSYTRGWQKGLMGQLIWVGEGTKVEQYSGYDMVVITSTAPISTYIL